MNKPKDNEDTALTISFLLRRNPLERKNKKKRNIITKNPLPILPSYPQKAIHLSLAKMVESKNEKKNKRNALSNGDLIIDIFPSHIHLTISSKIKIEDSTINKILLIFSVESYGSGITNQGIINMIKLKIILCTFDIFSNLSGSTCVDWFFSSNILGSN
jgi:hypothetical protein